MGTVKTTQEIQAMREGGVILAFVLAQVARRVATGVTTAFLNKLAHELILSRNAKPSFLKYQPHNAVSPYPAALCTSVNDEVVHIIPSERKLKEGDIIGLDLGLWYGGMCVDAAVTVGVGAINQEAQKLIDVTRESLCKGIAAVKNGARTGDIGCAVQTYVEKNGFGIVRDLAGHGVGYKVHEDPSILNFGRKGTGDILKTGMTIALEPMVTQGDWRVTVDKDGWGIRTRDGKLSAHLEHMSITLEICNGDSVSMICPFSLCFFGFM